MHELAAGKNKRRISRITVIWLLVSLSAAILPYAASLDGEFILDDHELIVNNPFSHSLSKAGAAFVHHFLYGYQDTESLYYRPLVTVSYQINYALAGPNPMAFRLTNLLLGAIMVVLVFMIARSLLGNTHAAGIASVAFAVLPSHAESIAWVSGRTDILAGIFMLGSFLLFLKVCRAKKRFDWLLASVCVLLFACALFSKETAVVLPVLLAVYAWAFGGVAKREAVKWASVLAPPIILYLLLRQHAIGTFIVGQDVGMLTERLWRAGPVYTSYLRMLFGPKDLRIFYGDLTPGLHITMPEIGAWVIMTGVAALVIWARKRHLLIAFGGAWLLISLLPASGIVFGRTLLPADRFVYIPSVGSSILLGWVFIKAYGIRPRWLAAFPAIVTVIAASFLIYSAVLAFCGSQYYASSTAWALRIAEIEPEHRELRLTSAQLLFDAGYVREAAAQYEAVIELSADYTLDADIAVMEHQLGLMYVSIGDLQKAADAFRRATTANSDYGIAWRDLARAELKLGRFAQAVESFEKAFGLLEPGVKDHLELGQAYKEIGRTGDAICEFEAVLSLDEGGRYGMQAQTELDALRRAEQQDRRSR